MRVLALTLTHHTRSLMDELAAVEMPAYRSPPSDTAHTQGHQTTATQAGSGIARTERGTQIHVRRADATVQCQLHTPVDHVAELERMHRRCDELSTVQQTCAHLATQMESAQCELDAVRHRLAQQAAALLASADEKRALSNRCTHAFAELEQQAALIHRIRTAVINTAVINTAVINTACGSSIGSASDGDDASLVSSAATGISEQMHPALQDIEQHLLVARQLRTHQHQLEQHNAQLTQQLTAAHREMARLHDVAEALPSETSSQTSSISTSFQPYQRQSISRAASTSARTTHPDTGPELKQAELLLARAFAALQAGPCTATPIRVQCMSELLSYLRTLVLSITQSHPATGHSMASAKGSRRYEHASTCSDQTELAVARRQIATLHVSVHALVQQGRAAVAERDQLLAANERLVRQLRQRNIALDEPPPGVMLVMICEW